MTMHMMQKGGSILLHHSIDHVLYPPILCTPCYPCFFGSFGFFSLFNLKVTGKEIFEEVLKSSYGEVDASTHPLLSKTCGKKTLAHPILLAYSEMKEVYIKLTQNIGLHILWAILKTSSFKKRFQIMDAVK